MESKTTIGILAFQKEMLSIYWPRLLENCTFGSQSFRHKTSAVIEIFLLVSLCLLLRFLWQGSVSIQISFNRFFSYHANEPCALRQVVPHKPYQSQVNTIIKEAKQFPPIQIFFSYIDGNGKTTLRRWNRALQVYVHGSSNQQIDIIPGSNLKTDTQAKWRRTLTWNCAERNDVWKSRAAQWLG